MRYDEIRAAAKRLFDRKEEVDFAAATILRLNPKIGMRPSEWRSAYLEGDVLHWTAEKTANGRGNVKDPRLKIKSMSKCEASRWLLNCLKPYREDDLKWSHLVDRLRSRIADVCEKLEIEGISLYTTRDILIACELLLGTDTAEVAAKVNHKSTRTQRRHYAPKRFGYKMTQSPVSVPASLVATVRQPEPFLREKIYGSVPRLAP